MSMSFLDPRKVIGDITGSNQAAKGAEKAAEAQIQSAQGANDLLGRINGENQAYLSPYRNLGTGAVNQLAAMIGLNPDGTRSTIGFDTSAITSLPGYQFGLDQGQQAMQRQLAASGMGSSGAALKAAQRYGQGYAQQQYGNYMNQLQALAGMGQNAAAQTAQFNQNYGGAASDNLTGMGNARASAYIARGNTGVQNFNNLMKMAGMAASAMGGSGGAGAGAGGGGGMNLMSLMG